MACAVAIVTATAVQLAQAPEATVDVQLLAINDFHGALEPASGGVGRIASADAGGIEYLGAHLARLKAANPNTVIVSAGDNIGGTPLLSSLFHDEASVEALNLAGLQVSALGNHELDEGWWELYRIQKGGCHPVDGCQDGTPFSGASFSYLAANVTLDPQKADPQFLKLADVRGTEPRPLLPAYAIREVNGVRIGFIGLILQAAPTVIIPASIRGLTFGPEAEAANDAARVLREQGVRAIVVLMHQGGDQRGSDINGCDSMSRDQVELMSRMSDDIDVVVSGHSHQAYNCTIDGKLVTSAASTGRLITDIDLRLRRSDGEVVAKGARNVVVTRDVDKDSRQSALIARYRPLAEKVGNRVVGTIVSSLLRGASDAGEFPLGNVVADAFLEAGQTPGGGAELAFTNPGSIRADVVAGDSMGPSPVTYAHLFSVLPFGNEVIVKSLTGDALVEVLEQQFGSERTRIMQVSKGFIYAYDTGRPRGQRIDRSSVRINGAPLDPARRYRVATNSFLWTGGDDLGGLSRGTEPVTVGVDVDVVADYFSRHSPVAAGSLDRIRRVP
ncbi:MAG TPA: bifunctional metallophosphatase/5'-nucleotidase [Vicinamibacterales bacterium]